MTSAVLNRLPVDRTTKKKLSKAGQKTADEILSAAEKLFTLKGFKGTTLKEVSEECGANTALISYYFGGKEGLRDAVFQKHVDNAGSGFAKLFKTEVSTFDRERLKGLISFFLQQGHEDDTMFRLVLWSMIDAGDLSDRMTQMIWQPFFDRLRDILVHVSGGALSPANAEVRVWLMMQSVHGYIQCRWHSANHMKFIDNNETFFNNYRNLIVEDVIDSVLRA